MVLDSDDLSVSLRCIILILWLNFFQVRKQLRLICYYSGTVISKIVRSADVTNLLGDRSCCLVTAHLCLEPPCFLSIASVICFNSFFIHVIIRSSAAVKAD